ncbi:hypothetical protein Y032_0183g960 [Ancylostoma ceylanicum]|uniref:Uncharacterized protein n=1 Tax=Ancylostoma ceylanicum TaxID=53326 RepID=A0A016SRP5_9BILA|nr:hypothetical protein Y032_0183g960 [Ancylostoma ceylanicum]
MKGVAVTDVVWQWEVLHHLCRCISRCCSTHVVVHVTTATPTCRCVELVSSRVAVSSSDTTMLTVEL